MTGVEWMDYQTAFNIVLGGFSFLAGVLITNIWKEIKTLQRTDSAITERVGQIEVLVAGNYTTREEFTRVMDKVFSKLDSINERLSEKVDK